MPGLEMHTQSAGNGSVETSDSGDVCHTGLIDFYKRFRQLRFQCVQPLFQVPVFLTGNGKDLSTDNTDAVQLCRIQANDFLITITQKFCAQNFWVIVIKKSFA